MAWTIQIRRQKRRMVLLNKDYFFDEELEEKYYESLERKIPEKEMEFLRNVYDEGWDIPKSIGKLHVGVMN